MQRRTLERDLPCTACGYSLRGLNESSLCPECGLRVRRTLAAERLQNWKRLRGDAPEVVEGFCGATIGVFALTLTWAIVNSRHWPTIGVMAFSGILVGLAFTLSFSSVRRSRRRRLAATLALAVPSFLASVLWLLMAIALISSIEGAWL